MTKDENYIERSLKEFEEAWNKHDVKAFSSLFAADADFTNVFGMPAYGKKHIEEFHAPLFSSVFKESRFTILGMKIKFIKPDVAAVDGSWEMAGATDPSGNPWEDRKGLMNLIMIKEKKNWVISSMHNMDLTVIPH